MNFLAHAHLSFNNPEILVGNLISDFVKGKKQYNYPQRIHKGILLHRAIDQFTDEHPATKQAKTVFREKYRLYSAAFVDVVYDHFLANDSSEFTEESLLDFTTNVYVKMDRYLNRLPPKFEQMFAYMKQQNWLFNYRSRWELEKSFGGLVRRATFLSEHQTAFLLFNEHYDELQTCYSQFFPDVKFFAREKLKNLTGSF